LTFKEPKSGKSRTISISRAVVKILRIRRAAQAAEKLALGQHIETTIWHSVALMAAPSLLAQARERFGRIDVAIDNAGYGVFGTIEEVSEADSHAQIETNLFGALWVTQAVLPVMRAQGSGHIIQVSTNRRRQFGSDRRSLQRLKVGARRLQ
jgi:NAD(P)-dependent dehydrogenase (short-subunit alcohol dehydrogenase family)